MYSLLAYILQVNILLTIVYIGYCLLLKKLTFYQLNRGYFLFGGVFAFVYPFLDIKSLFQKHIEPIGEWMAYLPEIYTQQVEKSVYTLENVIYVAIGLVGLWFGIRLGIQLLSLLRIHLRSEKTVWKTYWYQNVLFPIVPFSFLNKIYVHKEQHQEPELYDIFEHEDIHVKGLHSLDILMFEILLIVCWYNPFVWLMRRAVRQNLEYLTDHQVLNKGVDRQAYQYSLLQVSKQGASLGVSNQFNFKFLKKRIMMMNKKKSSKLELSKYAFLLPIVIFSAGAFTISKADSKITRVVDVVREIELDSFTADGEDLTTELYSQEIEGNPMVLIDGNLEIIGKHALRDLDQNDIASMVVLKGESALTKYGAEAVDGVIEITTKANATNHPTPKATDNNGRAKGDVIDTVRDVTNSSRDTSKTLEGGATGIRVVGHRGEQDASDTTGKPRVELRGKIISAISNEVYNKRQEDMKPGAEPLYVIDGEIADEAPNLKAVDPNTIESITVLKDEEARAAYGEKGKNGVIIITTIK